MYVFIIYMLKEYPEIKNCPEVPNIGNKIHKTQLNVVLGFMLRECIDFTMMCYFLLVL